MKNIIFDRQLVITLQYWWSGWLKCCMGLVERHPVPHRRPIFDEISHRSSVSIHQHSIFEHTARSSLQQYTMTASRSLQNWKGKEGTHAPSHALSVVLIFSPCWMVPVISHLIYQWPSGISSGAEVHRAGGEQQASPAQDSTSFPARSLQYLGC